MGFVRHDRVVNQRRELVELSRSAQNIDVGKPPENVRPIPLGHATDDADHEGGAPVVPPAIANAVFDATGVRLRTVPFTPERVKAAIEKRST